MEQPELTRSLTPSTQVIGNNKKYPDVPLFYGSKEEWDGWRFHLDAKFRQSAVLFPTERDKMDYIRDHCKSIAFDVLKARADPLSDDPYVTADEMIKELHSTFGDFDKYAKCDALLHSPSFGMAITKKNESFDEFYARFSATVAPLGYSESHKISTLKRLITLKLRLRILDGQTPPLYRHFIERLRRTDQGMRFRKEQGEDLKEIDREEFFNGGANTRYPAGFRARLQREGTCFKCLGHGHRPGPSAPCASKKNLSYEEAKVMLAREAKDKEKAVEKD